MSTALSFLSPCPFCNQQTFKANRPEHQASWFWRGKPPQFSWALQTGLLHE
jgi:hypothetical protein